MLNFDLDKLLERFKELGLTQYGWKKENLFEFNIRRWISKEKKSATTTQRPNLERNYGYLSHITIFFYFLILKVYFKIKLH